MNTKLAATQIRIQQWREIIKSRAESGLSINDFCEENNLSLNQYYYWLRKVREAAIEKSGMHFVEIKQENPSFSCSKRKVKNRPSALLGCV